MLTYLLTPMAIMVINEQIHALTHEPPMNVQSAGCCSNQSSPLTMPGEKMRVIVSGYGFSVRYYLFDVKIFQQIYSVF